VNAHFFRKKMDGLMLIEKGFIERLSAACRSLETLTCGLLELRQGLLCLRRVGAYLK
jgi:hypothetical protein